MRVYIYIYMRERENESNIYIYTYILMKTIASSPCIEVTCHLNQLTLRRAHRPPEPAGLGTRALHLQYLHLHLYLHLYLHLHLFKHMFVSI